MGEMKQGKKDAATNPENQTPALAPAKAKKEKKQKPVDAVQLPVLVELTHTVSTILLIFVGVSMAMISLLTGASLLNLVLRTSVALLVIGSLLAMISSQVSSGLLQASLIEQEEAQKSQIEKAEAPETPSDIETHNVAEA
jgi:hypothetical protein